jgi:uracil-DNA glycosylase
VIGRGFKVSVDRGRFVESRLAPAVFATLHPSALLRVVDETERERAFDAFVADLKMIHRGLGESR